MSMRFRLSDSNQSLRPVIWRPFNASDFKARCLAILDRVSATGERVIILKRGRPVAELGPASHARAEYPQLELKGTVKVVGDIVGPVVPEEDWESLGQ